MHKRLVNYCKIELTLTPLSPILIKSGKEGADPTKPDMEFVETYHSGGRSIYLPGSSLKGAIRAHAERIVRTVGREKRPDDPKKLWANDPIHDDYKYLEKKDPPDIYRLSSFTDQMFGNTAIASRIRIKDAYPVNVKEIKLSERNGVAIDRMFGSVIKGGLFNYQVCTAGEFKTEIHLKNFTLAQLGLIGLVLRDLDEGWFGIGYAKSRGLGLVEVELNSAVVQYPGCVMKNNEICLLGGSKKWSNTKLLGVGTFLETNEANSYGFSTNDEEETPIAAQDMDLGFGVQLIWQGEVQVKDLFNRSVKAWKRKVEREAA
ncbi:MAG: RAMP superfamily CRISPR-associated protein [Oscillatoria sp. PMC 1068.18]|nr:RAMP superfamily CRISPR-associated protein [Oscillatoria sp. PMC 1076.18]MEC4988465.1 RAMP superfamily CRISPR-associated protein [Oscillatoria sp. PMC 1068.18]